MKVGKKETKQQKIGQKRNTRSNNISTKRSHSKKRNK